MLEPPPLQKIINGFTRGARQACEGLVLFHPDLVLVLMHSGRVPMYVTRALWQMTQDDPFPPVVGTNIGREKMEHYLAVQERQGRDQTTLRLELQMRPDRFLGWVAEETDWTTQLAAQLDGVGTSDAAPWRILVLDDWMNSGITQTLVTFLLNRCYPESQVMHCGNFANRWCDTLGQLWLRRKHPDVYRQWWHLARAAKRRGDTLPMVTDLTLLVPGTEDVAPTSLDWQPITAASVRLERLSAYLPAEEWLTLPDWAVSTLVSSVRERSP